MALVKCPRCELNYMNDNEEMCSVCRREVRGESEQFEMIELCSECGENPAVPGYELCSSCLKEHQRRNTPESTDDVIVHDERPIVIDSVSNMDEIDLGGDLDDIPFDADEADFSEDDDEDLEGDGEE